MRNVIYGVVTGVLGVTLGMLLLLLVGACEAKAETLTVTPANTTTLYGVVDNRSVAHAIKTIHNAKSEVTILIDSPGGLVSSGLKLLRAMNLAQARGVKIRCAVTGIAMSMAFYVLSECNTRYALPTAQMLWHPIRIFMMGVLTGPDAAKIGTALRRYEAPLIARLEALVGLDHKTFYKHWINESVHYPSQLPKSFISTVDSVEGVPLNALQQGSTDQEMLDLIKRRGKSELILIYSPIFNPIFEG